VADPDKSSAEKEDSMRNLNGVRICITLVLLFALLTTVVYAETPVTSSVESRLYLAFQVQESEVQKWLPAPWQLNPVPAGPSKGANLFVAFVQELVRETSEGKPSASCATALYVVLIVPAKHSQTGEESSIVTRVYMTDPDRIPGPYKNALKADVRRELTLKGENLAPGTGSDDWEMKEAGGGTMVVHLAYQQSVQKREKREPRIRSSIDPNLCYIYSIEQGSELLRSVPAGVDQLQSYEFRSTVPELAKLLDDRSKVVSVSASPWFALQVSLP
jgi:hypothetical protein